MGEPEEYCDLVRDIDTSGESFEVEGTTSYEINEDEDKFKQVS